MIRFISQAIRNYKTTGAIAPSSRFLAREMVQSMPMTSKQRILEVGAGTGAFTKQVLDHLQDGDELHIVELNTEFCAALETSLLCTFRKEHPAILVELHNTPIEEAGLVGKFDAVICGLPFNNFPVELVQHLFDVMLGLLKDGAELAYFEYLGVRGLKRAFGTPSMRKETKKRTADIDSRIAACQGSQQTVWLNIPSCRVVRLKK